MYKWIIGALIFVAVLLYFSKATERVQKFDRKLSYTADSYAPYDTRFFRESLEKYTRVERVNEAPAEENLNTKFLVVCSPYFHPTEEEAKRLKEYVSDGNTLFLSTFEIGEAFQRHFFVYFRSHSKAYLGTDDSLKLYGSQIWEYPGEGGGPALVQMAIRPKILYKDGNNKPALVKYTFGAGEVYLLLRPTAISNYFLLHENNYTFLECLLPIFENQNVQWNEYFETRKEQRLPQEPGKSYLWEMIKKHTALQFALAVLLLGSLLFFYNYSQRLRDPIEEYAPPQNGRLQFLRTMARLPFTADQVAKKWKLVVLHHLEQRYRIYDLSLETSESLATKTGQSEAFAERLLRYLKTEKFSAKSYKEFYHFASPFIYHG